MSDTKTDYKLVPVEPTQDMERAAESYWNARRFKGLSDNPRTWAGVYQAMLAAAPAVQREPDDEWIPTNGEKPDLPDSTLVDIKFANGFLSFKRRADYWVWTNVDIPSDITHYRIHQPMPAEQQPIELSDYARGFRDGKLDRLIDEVVAESELVEALLSVDWDKAADWGIVDLDDRDKAISLLATYHNQKDDKR